MNNVTRILSGVSALAIAASVVALDGADESSGRGLPPTGDGEGTVQLTQTGGNFALPINVAFAPGEPDNLYVTEQDGLVRVVVNGTTQAEPFLDLTSETSNSGEAGLLSVAFHPDYETNGLVYAYYNDSDNGDIVISEVEATDPLNADESTLREVIRVKHRYAGNHNGGQIRFGPDGFLYFATGDGGNGGDPRENAQNRFRLLGKLVRIDPLESGGDAYSVPGSNPYVGRAGRNEIYALGLRNPFRFNFDSETGWILIGDVGQGAFEEIDMERPDRLRGANFGWDRFEGFRRYRDAFDNVASTPAPRNHSKPTLAYGQSRGRSVIGGVVVRDPDLPNLYGRYLFTDFFADRLRSFVPKLRRKRGFKEIGPTVSLVTSFNEDPVTNDVYITQRGDGSNGRVLRIDPAG